MGNNEYVDIVKRSIREYRDFPKPGIIFRDIFSLMKDAEAFQALNKVIVDHVKNVSPKPNVIVGLEARGFVLGSVIAVQTGLPFVPIRKKGKLPGDLKQQCFKLEYGQDMFEIQSDSIQKGQNVIIVDDLLATGGSLKAACELVNSLEGNVQQCFVVMELLELKGREALDVPVYSIVKY